MPAIDFQKTKQFINFFQIKRNGKLQDLNLNLTAKVMYGSYFYPFLTTSKKTDSKISIRESLVMNRLCMQFAQKV